MGIFCRKHMSPEKMLKPRLSVLILRQYQRQVKIDGLMAIFRILAVFAIGRSLTAWLFISQKYHLLLLADSFSCYLCNAVPFAMICIIFRWWFMFRRLNILTWYASELLLMIKFFKSTCTLSFILMSKSWT